MAGSHKSVTTFFFTYRTSSWTSPSCRSRYSSDNVLLNSSTVIFPSPSWSKTLNYTYVQ
jgi:hypothetical protein